ncbi:MAG: hypothetical protein AABW92_00490, partial [Nanoarchaeota archaeon]
MKKNGESEHQKFDSVLKQHTHNKQLVFVIIILVLFYLLIYFVNTNAEVSLGLKKVQCLISIGENRDLCFLNLSEKAENIDFCNGINGKWTRDYCYLEYNQCEFIDDFNLQYQCNRIKMRPHMLAFISKSSDVSEDTFVDIDECIELKGYNRLNCIYGQALYISKENFTEGVELCKQFENELYSGECEYFLVLSLMPYLSINTDETISYIMDYCKDIKNPSWGSECYFLLADELSYLSNSDDYDYEIVLACSLS